MITRKTASKAVYDSVEIWINEMNKYLEEGNSMESLKLLGFKFRDFLYF